MTYISALRCAGGITLCADTQETVNGEKQYSEKLTIPESGNYPIAIGGAGVDELIDAFCQELLGRVRATPPRTKQELRSTIEESIKQVYEEDVPVSVLKKQYRTPEFIVAAKPTDDDFVIFRLKGKRIYDVRNYVIIGYATPPNQALLKRMYRESVPIAQGAILGAYLVAQSKQIDDGVGFDTRIATVASHGSFIEDQQYVVNLEARANELLRAFDDLFLIAADVATHDVEFEKRFEAFKELVKTSRQKYLRETSLSLFELASDPAWQGDGYAKFQDGTSLSNTVTNRCIVFRDKKPWLIVPDGYTEDGRSKIRLIPLNSPEAQGQVSFEQPIKLIGVPLDQLATPEGRQANQKTLSDNADKLRSIVRSDRRTAQGWAQLKVRNPLRSRRSGNKRPNRKA
ncbi:MAG: hypothetical protein LAP21_21070 [Acidobacteriia bacterium]|nr:hypothetical protein [Terriglobia bacterium]